MAANYIISVERIPPKQIIGDKHGIGTPGAIIRKTLWERSRKVNLGGGLERGDCFDWASDCARVDCTESEAEAAGSSAGSDEIEALFDPNGAMLL